MRKLNEQKVQAKLKLSGLDNGNTGFAQSAYNQSQALVVIAHALADIADTLALQMGRNE